MGRGPLLKGPLSLVAFCIILLLLGTSAEARQLLKKPAALKDRLAAKWLTNRELEAWGKDFASRCSSVAKLHTGLGKSVRGFPLWLVEISDRPGVDEAEPNFIYIANMHGNEISGRMFLPRFAEWLCASNGKDDRATRLVRDFHIFVMPTMNPDGYPSRRNNRAPKGGFDLNRNFPDQWRDKGSDLKQPLPNSQPEVKAVISFFLGRTWLAAANFHEGDAVVNYPWDGYPDESTRSGGYNAAPDDVTFKFLAKGYASLNPAIAGGPFKDGITNGAQWYPIYGGMQDWSYINAGCMHLTIETSIVKAPGNGQIGALWDQNRESLINLPLFAYQGVRGLVTSAATGAPLAATLRLKDSSAAQIPFYSSAATGFYARPLAPGGNFTVVASAQGYADKEANFLVPTNGSGVVQNFAL